ncbi:MAG: hypothetical protein CMH83_12915 [Nocardioides sp.]|nr:hypothetical protein [Nocardioides sp.]
MTALTIGLLASLLALGPTAPASADEAAVEATASLASTSSTTVSVPVADGITPTALRGRVVASDLLGGPLRFSVGGRTLKTVAAETGPVFLPVRASDVGDDGAIDLTMTYRPTERCPGGSGPADVALTNLTLVYTGDETAPRTVGTFFPDSSPRIDVSVPADASDDLLAAALTAVASLTARYGDATVVQLSVASRQLPRVGPGQRLIRLEPGTGDTSTDVAVRFGLPTLTLTGNGDGLRTAAQALGSDALTLASGPSSTGLSETLERRTEDLEVSFADLGLQRLTLVGPAEATATVGVAQDVFGGPVDGLTVHAEGTYTAVPDTTDVQLSTYVNGYLVDSQLLDPQADGNTVTIDADVPADVITSDNGIEFRLSSTADVGACEADDDGSVPVEVHLDGGASTVTATRGDGGQDLSAYPQVLGGVLPVALRPTGEDRVDAAIDAAYLVHSLQAAAVAPLDVTLVDADSLVQGSSNGLLVGATPEDADTVGAPLRLDSMRLLDYAEAEFGVGSNQPFAALESVVDGDRHLLLLGTWTADGSAAPALPRALATQAATDGWGTLADDLLVVSPGTDPFSLSSAEVVPQEEVVEERTGFVWWLGAGIAVLLLLLLWQVARTARRDHQVKRLVDAQERADSDARGSVTLAGEEDPGHDDDGHPRA